MAPWQATTNALQHWQWIGTLSARLSIGFLFTFSGAGKLFVRVRREQMRQTLGAAGIPVPDMSVVFVSSVEFVFGASLVLGSLAPLCCLMLTAVMLGALSTTVLPGIKVNPQLAGLANFSTCRKSLYVVTRVWLFFSGPGWLSLDHLILSSAGR